MNGIRFASIASGALLLLSGSALHARTRSPARLQMDECNLLTIADASKALEQSSQPGKHMTEGTPPGCLWSADPKISDSSRKIGVNAHTLRAFTFAKKPAITTIKIEPVSGVGDREKVAFVHLQPRW